MSRADWTMQEFASGAQASDVGGSGKTTRLLLLICVVLMAAAGLYWASWATLEEVAIAEGRVIPSGRARGVESLEGGIVAEIFVTEGDRVATGQMLVRIDDTGAAASLGELSARRISLQARALRLAAELDGLSTLDFSSIDLEPQSPLALRETALFDSRRASYISQRAVVEAQVLQREQEITELANGIARAEETITLLEEEIDLRQASGVVPRAQIIPIERELTASRAERDRLQSRQLQADASLIEAKARLTELDLLRRADTNTERSETLNELSVIEQSIKRASDVVTRTTLRAPVPGIVSVLNVNTIGSVIAPGEEILRIVPADVGLEVEARLRPQDIAFVRPDLPAKVKLSAFDFTIYGSLPGRVVRIGADAEVDEATGQTYFPIIVETDANTLERGTEMHAIRPGMVATVDVLTGERTVLDYLLKPFRKARLEALRER